MALEAEDNNTSESVPEGVGLEVVEYTQSRSSWLNPFTWMNSWKISSMATLAKVERNILSSVWDAAEHKFVPISNGTKVIRTLAMNTESKKTPLVLVHGMGAGVGFWVLNLESLAKDRPLYAFDILGFGRSSRPKFSQDALLAETEFVESVEEWRKGMKLEKFILLGHSLGGFIASAYAIRYPEKVRHLILVDPWGFPEKPTETDRRVPVPIWIKVVAKVLQPFNPLAALRAAGPFGPGLVSRLRPDLARKFHHLFADDTVAQYTYHCNAQHPSGETAFKHMTIPFGWAKYPMIQRITDLPRSLPMTVIYGSRSWVDSGIGYQIKYLRNDSYVDVQVVKGAGHHVYADKAYQFNTMVNRICHIVDNRMDFGQPFQYTNRSRVRGDSGSLYSPKSDQKRGGKLRTKSESLPTFSRLQKQTLSEETGFVYSAGNEKSDNVTKSSSETPETSSKTSEKKVSFVVGEDVIEQQLSS